MAWLLVATLLIFVSSSRAGAVEHAGFGVPVADAASVTGADPDTETSTGPRASARASASLSRAPARPAVAVARERSDIRIDGVLDEPGWQSAAPITDFRLMYVREGQAPSEETEVRVLVDADHVYFGIVCHNRSPGAIRSSLAPRDQILDDDQIAVHLDTYLDRHRAYIFGVNAHGVQLDGILDGLEPDFTWDAVWSAEVVQTADAWIVEMAIPLRAIRFPVDGDGTWGLWFRRQITKHDEVCSWPLWRQAEQGDIMLQAGDLTGMHDLSGGGGVELQPYVASARSETRTFGSPGGGPLQPLTGGEWARSTDANAGLDVAYSITSTLTANATLNPDFSQVEADAVQIDVNERFPLFFPEKRPFFLEGSEIFSMPLDLVYTRRIADPAIGGKVTGKQGRVRVGALAVWDDGGGSQEGIGAGPADAPSNEGFVGIGRATYDIGERNSVGVLVADRSSGSGVMAPGTVRGRHNTVLSGDAKLRLAQSLFFEGQAAWSTTQAESPTGDADFSDGAYEAELRFADGIRDVAVYQEYLGPNFRSETGFLERVDLRETGFDSDFFVRPENAWIRSWRPILSGYVLHDHTGGLEEWWLSPMIDWEFQRSTTMHTMYVRSMERWLGRDYGLNTYIFRFGNSNWRAVSVNFFMRVGDGVFYGPTDPESFEGWSERYTVDATVRPSPRLTSAVSLTRSRFSREFAGGEVFDVWVLGANTTYQFTRRLYARVYPQYDTGREHLDADILLGYVVHPGTVLYLGMNRDYEDVAGRHRSTGRSFFFKASYRLLR